MVQDVQHPIRRSERTGFPCFFNSAIYFGGKKIVNIQKKHMHNCLVFKTLFLKIAYVFFKQL